MATALLILSFVIGAVDVAGAVFQQVGSLQLSKTQTEALRKVASAISLDADTIAKIKNRRLNSLQDLEKILQDFPKLRDQIQTEMNKIREDDSKFDATLQDIEAKLQGKRDELYAISTDAGYFGANQNEKVDRMKQIQDEIDTLTMDKQRFVKEHDELNYDVDKPRTIDMSDKTDLSYLSQTTKGGTNK